MVWFQWRGECLSLISVVESTRDPFSLTERPLIFHLLILQKPRKNQTRTMGDNRKV